MTLHLTLEEHHNNYYTYAYLREDKTPYYVGKGKGNRAFLTKRVGAKPPKDKSRIIYLKQNLTEEEAFKHEIYMIAVLGRKDLGTGILHNRTDGGEGTSGFIHSKVSRRKMSVAKKGKLSPKKGKPLSKETKRKMSEAQKGKITSEETRRKIGEIRKGKTHSEETKKIIGEARKGKKWWNDGCRNVKLMTECPGEGWRPGMK